MYVYSELFQQCKDEAELAAVMSHEYGHVYARHVQKGMDRQKGIIGATTGVGVVGSLVGGESTTSSTGRRVRGWWGRWRTSWGWGSRGRTRRRRTSWGSRSTRGPGGSRPVRGVLPAHDRPGAGHGQRVLLDHPTLKSRVENVKQWVSELPASAESWQKPRPRTRSSSRRSGERAKALARRCRTTSASPTHRRSCRRCRGAA